MVSISITSLRVLVAEDNPVNQLFVARLVERQGHSVHVVSNGQLAIDALRQETFDVVLMDLGMPLLGGFETVCQLRQQEKQTGDHLPIIAMTASATSFDRVRCLAVGMDDFISKPVQAAALAAALARVVHGSPQTWQESETPYRMEPAANEIPACNLAAALRKLGGDKNFLNQLVQLFLDTVPEQLQSLQTAMQGRHRKTIGDMAHAVKGSVRYFFAHSVYDTAQRLEIGSLSDDMAVLEQTYAMLLNHIRRLCTELRMPFSVQEVCPTSGVL